MLTDFDMSRDIPLDQSDSGNETVFFNAITDQMTNYNDNREHFPLEYLPKPGYLEPIR